MTHLKKPLKLGLLNSNRSKALIIVANLGPIPNDGKVFLLKERDRTEQAIKGGQRREDGKSKKD